MAEPYKFKIGDKIIGFNKYGIIVDIFEGTPIENIWVKILYDKTEDLEEWLCTEKISNIKLIPKEKVIYIVI